MAGLLALMLLTEARLTRRRDQLAERPRIPIETPTWTILEQRLRWSRQRPARRAAEAWMRQEWPRIKKHRFS